MVKKRVKRASKQAYIPREDVIEEPPKKKNNILIIGLFVILIFAGIWYLYNSSGTNLDSNGLPPNTEINPNKEQIYFFYSSTCPHCASQKPFMISLIEDYPKIQLLSYEVQSSEDNLQKFREFLQNYDVPSPHGVPTTFIGDRYFVGFNDAIALEMENAVKELVSNN